MTLLASVDTDANLWTLEVEAGSDGEWQPLPAKVLDANLNWSTADLTLWDQLRDPYATDIERIFRDVNNGSPAGTFAVMWDISAWCYTGDPWYRFIDPAGEANTFRYQSLDLGNPPRSPRLSSGRTRPKLERLQRRYGRPRPLPSDLPPSGPSFASHSRREVRRISCRQWVFSRQALVCPDGSQGASSARRLSAASDSS